MGMKRSLYRLAGCLVLTAFLCSLSGCNMDWLTLSDDEDVQLNRDDPLPEGTVEIPVIHVYVYRVELPIGSIAASEELWELLKTPEMSAEERWTLANNGIRFAVGDQDNWDEMEDVLMQLSGVQLDPIGLASLRDKAVPVSMQTVDESRTIFLVHPDGTLSGMDYPPSEYYMTFLFTPGADNESQVVTGVPQVETLARRTTIDTSSGHADLVTRPEVFTVNPLQFQFTLGKKAFFVIAPGDGIDRSSSLGRAMLTRGHGGVPVETMVIVVSEVTTIQRGS